MTTSHANPIILLLLRRTRPWKLPFPIWLLWIKNGEHLPVLQVLPALAWGAACIPSTPSQRVSQELWYDHPALSSADRAHVDVRWQWAPSDWWEPRRSDSIAVTPLEKKIRANPLSRQVWMISCFSRHLFLVSQQRSNCKTRMFLAPTMVKEEEEAKKCFGGLF